MKVRELIDMLSDQPPDAEVELVVVAPVDDDDPAITVDRYSVEAMLPWVDDDADDEDGLTVWLIGGEDADVDALIDQLEQDAEASGGFEL
ncbi:MAG: hypothetical protein ACKO27_08695 [Ilumatobacteraceae bacterium]